MSLTLIFIFTIYMLGKIVIIAAGESGFYYRRALLEGHYDNGYAHEHQVRLAFGLQLKEGQDSESSQNLLIELEKHASL